MVPAARGVGSPRRSVLVATSSLVRYEDPLDVRERGAIGGFLAGYSGNTRVSYTTDLRLFAAWCVENRLRLLAVRRAHLEMFARTMEQQGRMRSTVARRSSTRCSFYRYCHLEASGRALPLTIPQAGHGVMSASVRLCQRTRHAMGLNAAATISDAGDREPGLREFGRRACC